MVAIIESDNTLKIISSVSGSPESFMNFSPIIGVKKNMFIMGNFFIKNSSLGLSVFCML
jgi:hypothetical protein